MSRLRTAINSVRKRRNCRVRETKRQNFQSSLCCARRTTHLPPGLAATSLDSFSNSRQELYEHKKRIIQFCGNLRALRRILSGGSDSLAWCPAYCGGGGDRFAGRIGTVRRTGTVHTARWHQPRRSV